MAFCNHEKREVTFKLVYCGAPGAGKTANLRHIHRKLDPHFRGNLVSHPIRRDGAVAFDFLSVKGPRTSDYQVSLQLYTAPGEPCFSPTQKTILRRADGIVFVADSEPENMRANRLALSLTHALLEQNRIDPARIPFVFQFNKRDSADALEPDLIDEFLGVTKPSFLATASLGHGVFSTLEELTDSVIASFHTSLIRGRHQIGEENIASSSNMALSN